MANIQAVGADGLTIVYLAASGTGEAEDPFVSRYDINGLDLLATEDSLLDAINKIPTFAYDASRLLVKTELAQPLTDSQLRAGPIEVLLDSTTITNTIFGATQSGAWTVSVDNQAALTDAELRAAPVAVTGDFYPVTQPISAVTLPLPNGAATEATLGSVNNKLPSLNNGRVPVESNHAQPLTDAQLRASVVNVSVSNLPATQPVSATSLPLPTGAATAANQTTLIGHVDGIETALAGTISVNTHLNQPLTNTELRASAVPVSVGNFPATQAVSATSLPLPTGAATAANQTAIIGHIDGIETALSGTIRVNTQLSQPLTNTELRASAVPVSVNNFPASQPVTVSSLPLPTGAASESTLSALNAKIPALSSGRIPVDIGALSLGSSIEITNDTGNPIAVSGSVTVSNFPATQVISGTVNTGLSQPLTDTQLRAAPVAVTGTFWQATQPVSLSSLPPLASGSNTIGAISNTSFGVSNFPSSFAATQFGTWSVGITNFPAIQAVSATSLPLPNGAATSAKQDTLIGHVDGIEAALSGTIAVNTGLNQPLTNTELRASPLDVNIDVSGLATEVSLNSLSSKLPQLTLVGDALKVDANVSLPSTYTVEVNNYSNLVSALQAATLKAEVTNNVSVIGEVSLDPTGLDLATATNQADIIYAISLLTGKFNNTSDRLIVDGSQVTQPVSGTVSANQNGNWNVKVSKLPDFFPLSAFGEPEVVNPYPLVQVDFVYGINSKLGVTEVFGTGSASKEATRPHMVLATGASNNSWARYRTKRYLKYRSGQGLKVMFSTMFSAGVDGSIQVSGVFYIENQSNVPTIIDGYGFGYNETSFGILHANNGVLTWTPKEDFNIDKLDGNGPSGVTIDPTKFNLYQIKYSYLGVGTVFFYVEQPVGGLVLVHTINYPNNYSVAQLGNPNLAMQSLVYNSTNNTNIYIKEVTKAGFISGVCRPLGPKISMDRTVSLSNTNETHMFTIRCNTTINGLTNRSQIHLVRIGGANSGNNAVVIRLYRNATVTGTNFINFDAVNSISAYSDVGTFTAATGELIHSVNLGASTNLFEEIESFDDILEPGDTLTVTAQGLTNGQVPQVSLIWVEDI